MFFSNTASMAKGHAKEGSLPTALLSASCCLMARPSSSSWCLPRAACSSVGNTNNTHSVPYALTCCSTRVLLWGHWAGSSRILPGCSQAEKIKIIHEKVQLLWDQVQASTWMPLLLTAILSVNRHASLPAPPRLLITSFQPHVQNETL